MTLLKMALLACFSAFMLFGCGRGSQVTNVHERAENSGDDTSPIVVAAGDISTCYGEGDQATAELLGAIHGTVLALGDEAYENGSPEQFASCYDPTWGQFKASTKPVPGNHEYHTEQAAGYFGYFEDDAGKQGQGYYSFDLGNWHLIALNSNCSDVGGCGVSSPQGRWLKNDLSTNSRKCTLAYFHYPLFTSGTYRPGIPAMRQLWGGLYRAGVDVVLNGHDHNYQRFASQDPEGKEDPERGIREFVVGTGGASHYAIPSPIANTQRYDDHTYGVLKLTLRPVSYGWRFVPMAGQTFTDYGSTRCH